MAGIQNYLELVEKIKEFEMCIKSNEVNYKYYLSVYKKGPAAYTDIIIDGMPKGSSNRITLDNLVTKLVLFQSLIEEQQKALYNLQQIKAVYDDYMAVNGGLKYLVIQLYYVDKRSLEEVAEVLNYSYNYIRHISSNIKKSLQQLDTIAAP